MPVRSLRFASDHSRGLILAAVGVFVLSFDSLLVRLAATDGWNVAFWRGALMALTPGAGQRTSESAEL